jgi:hypothetical protein
MEEKTDFTRTQSYNPRHANPESPIYHYTAKPPFDKPLLI